MKRTRFFGIIIFIGFLILFIFPIKTGAQQTCYCPHNCEDGQSGCSEDPDSGTYICSEDCCYQGTCPTPVPTLTPLYCYCDNPCSQIPNHCTMRPTDTDAYSCRPECCGPSGVCPTTPSTQTDFSQLIGVTLPNPIFGSDPTIGTIITTLLPYIYGAAGFAMLLYLVLGAYQIMVSSGDPKQMAAGREKVTYAIVGFVIMFAAYWITQLAGEILEIQQIRDIFG